MIPNSKTMTEQTEYIGTTSGRAKNGRFAKGNSFARGNPFAMRVAKFRKAIVGSVTEGDIEAIVKSLVFKAKTGDTAAAKLVLAYTAGMPQTFESPDVETSLHVTKQKLEQIDAQINACQFAVKSAGTAMAPIANAFIEKVFDATSSR